MARNEGSIIGGKIVTLMMGVAGLMFAAWIWPEMSTFKSFGFATLDYLFSVFVSIAFGCVGLVYIGLAFDIPVRQR